MRIVPQAKLSSQVYTILKDRIANHRFQPGSRLNVEKLSREMGVSRTPVWEAVGRLVQEGLLENVPNRGVFMLTLTPKMALELYQVREVLEGVAARLAALRIDLETLVKMEKCLEEQRTVIRADDLIAYSRLDFFFHAAVYEASGNSVLQELLQNIRTKMRPLALQVKPLLGEFLERHEEILDALRHRDPDRAEEAFRKHNQTMLKVIQGQIESGNWDE